MSLTVYLVLVLHVFVFIAVTSMIMVCGRHGIGPQIFICLLVHDCGESAFGFVISLVSVLTAWQVVWSE